MKCQSPFIKENKKNILNLSSAEFAHRVVFKILIKSSKFSVQLT